MHSLAGLIFAIGHILILICVPNSHPVLLDGIHQLLDLKLLIRALLVRDLKETLFIQNEHLLGTRLAPLINANDDFFQFHSTPWAPNN